MTDTAELGAGNDQLTQADAPANDPAVVNAPPANQAASSDPTPVVSKWPDDWRELLANGNQQELQRLQRIADPTGLYSSYRNLENRMNTAKPVLSDQPTPEELAAYRKANGIPETPQGYELVLEGITLGEDDKFVLDKMFDKFHSANLDPAKVNEVVKGYFEAQEQLAAEKVELEKAYKFENENTLRQDWGGNYVANLSAVKNLLAGMGEVGDILASAQDSEGRMLFNNADFLKAFANLAYELNPAGTVVPGSTGNQVEAIGSEIANIEAYMKSNFHEYHKNTAMKERYRSLLDARSKLHARGQ